MAKEPPTKRRRLAPNASHTERTDVPLHSSTESSDNSGQLLRVLKVLTCTSCHRCLNVKSGHVLLCARCNAPTCTICSRTCAAAPPSYPPTPRLSFSPTPPATPAPSPRRAALSLSNTNSQATPRRRKFRDGEDGSVKDENAYSDAGGEDSLESAGWTPGCGRIVCRGCCLELPQR
ncbi:hypothetical protein HETIRDRAFT_455044 [Heterobasidion irregulare TC 32-1]|uniref:B box-type domain-containing protein n=1 Tax=Heterobasidion irregulare (strain TC 32-1) TaxID=747525 RepID=W4JSG6_HETIT|nr:uncharacterized protein HETIRDRAFT_455044 [Heterobasidion irregulare TC 32-1]ETW76488.1 hypothetical protein HETIRDRAFT_455044 [Heterobasidion irregulare TC 32-1]